MNAFDFERFVAAQDAVYPQVVAELKAGRKQSHWMWFIFPQVAGLGHSETARRYAIASANEARAYLAHPILGRRLRDCVAIVNGITGKTAHEIFSSPDDVKFRSCLTLFGEAGGGDVFKAALEKYFGGVKDEATLTRLRRDFDG